MNIHSIYVDFNEMLEPDLVLLSKTDERTDSSGKIIKLYEGLAISIYSDDTDDQGNPDPLIAEGVVEKNTFQHPWGHAAKWCCRINEKGISNESDARVEKIK